MKCYYNANILLKITETPQHERKMQHL